MRCRYLQTFTVRMCARYFFAFVVRSREIIQSLPNENRTFSQNPVACVCVCMWTLFAHSGRIPNGLHIVLCNLKWIQYTSAQTYFAEFCFIPSSSSTSTAIRVWGEILDAHFRSFLLFSFWTISRQRGNANVCENFPYIVRWCSTCIVACSYHHHQQKCTKL